MHQFLTDGDVTLCSFDCGQLTVEGFTLNKDSQPAFQFPPMLTGPQSDANSLTSAFQLINAMNSKT